jgi:hypothetical protein
MADPNENKDFLAGWLEEDRQKMAVRVSELKEDYNVSHRLRASVQKFPWAWFIGAVLAGFLLSRLPARRKEVYLWSDSFQPQPLREIHPPASKTNGSHAMNKLWSFAKPVFTAFIGRELYQRLRQPSKMRAIRAQAESSKNVQPSRPVSSSHA